MAQTKTTGEAAAAGGAAPKRARDRIFAVADELFYRQGIRAVGVDTIAKEAGVAKISLYRAFPSKDDLVVAYLEDRNADYWQRWDKAFDKHEGDPRAQLRALMEYLADRTTAPGYRGCPFTNDATEFPEPSHPGRRVAEANKRELRQRLLRLAEALGAPDPQALADGLVLLVEGAYAISQTLRGRDGPGKAIVWAAEALVEAQLRRDESA
ncbi:TetR/AcrR family transcriptional regulator [Inquilinus sp. Marseille-Q2685]|uniref:TetR/AcrR family transcriptional regulator n=1 Tax=Inquilinus sp. Marseille-Q2685 TaxID=2866581 RepID=UPI001CE48CDC|nr:TetR/AcrR family transcriptional regulator [Inquilinus sp. Marseille-Q2685]